MATKYQGVGIDLEGSVVTNSGSPSGATDLTNKGYVDNLVAGLEWKVNVRAATTANGTLATAYANTQVIDGVTLATGDRILLKNQTSQTENGIYVVAASGAPTRSTDADSTAELNNATVSIVEGTTLAGKSYTQTTKNPTVGSSNIVFAQFNVGNVYTGSTGITLSGSDFQIASSAAGAGISFTSGVFAVTNTDGSITIGADTVSVAVAASGGIVSSGGAGIKVDSTVARIFRTGTHASTTSIAITHSLGTAACNAAVVITATGEVIECDMVCTSTSVMTFTFGVAPSANTLTFVIIG